MHNTDGTWIKEFSITDVWKLIFSKHSSKLEYKEFKPSSEVDELFLLEGEILDGDFISGYFFELNDNADGDFDWFMGESYLICYVFDSIWSFFLPNFVLAGS